MVSFRATWELPRTAGAGEPLGGFSEDEGDLPQAGEGGAGMHGVCAHDLKASGLQRSEGDHSDGVNSTEQLWPEQQLRFPLFNCHL